MALLADTCTCWFRAIHLPDKTVLRSAPGLLKSLPNFPTIKHHCPLDSFELRPNSCPHGVLVCPHRFIFLSSLVRGSSRRRTSLKSMLSGQKYLKSAGDRKAIC